MAKITRRAIIDNDQWIREHFEEIVDKYGGKVPYILVARGRIFPITAQDNIAEIEKMVTKRFGKPVGMPVPKREDFMSILPSKR
jgi:hypothetical protein